MLWPIRTRLWAVLTLSSIAASADSTQLHREFDHIQPEFDTFFRPLKWPAHGPPRTFSYTSYTDTETRLQLLAKEYPDILDVFTVQQRYGLPPTGKCAGAWGMSVPCQQWVAVVGKRERTRTATPEVFLSGALHGDEVVGPTVVLETVTFLVENYGSDPWVTMLVNSRSVVAVVSANAVGFSSHLREEERRDPNRDFPFDNTPDKCMRTAAARAINEIWREHIFQVGVTFHGGDNLIAYPWGDFTHCSQPTAQRCAGGWEAPDKTAMHQLGEHLVEVAGPFGGKGDYVLGEMNDVIYAVHGGMEDWAYGGSWHQAKTVCTPPTGGTGQLGAYDTKKTVYEDATLRAVLYLVETAFSKNPDKMSLGSTEAVLMPGGAGDGHVPRNIRLALAVIAAAQPEVIILTAVWTHSTRATFVPKDVAEAEDIETETVLVRWLVLGAHTVDKVHIDCDQVACIYTPSSSSSSSSAPPPSSSSSSSSSNWGMQVFEGFVLFPRSPSSALPPILRFQLSVVVDSHWARDSPQTHWVRARGNASYKASITNPTLTDAPRVVLGRDRWASAWASLSNPFLAHTDAAHDKELRGIAHGTVRGGGKRARSRGGLWRWILLAACACGVVYFFTRRTTADSR